MYVKWRREQLRDKARSMVLRAQIVRSYRDHVTGQVRSKFIAYLATIKEAHCDAPIVQERFWREIDKKLASLYLAPDGEERIREKLLERVPRPRSWSEILSPYAKFARGRIGV